MAWLSREREGLSRLRPKPRPWGKGEAKLAGERVERYWEKLGHWVGLVHSQPGGQSKEFGLYSQTGLFRPGLMSSVLPCAKVIQAAGAVWAVWVTGNHSPGGACG